MRQVTLLAALALGLSCARAVPAAAQADSGADAAPSLSMSSSQELAVPSDLKAAVDARKAELAKFKVGFGRFVDLHALKADDPSAGVVGSGYDYIEEVLKGAAASGLFQAAQLGVSNDDDGGAWDLVAGADKLGGEGRPLAVRWLSKDGALQSEALLLPAEWDREASDYKGKKYGAKRSSVMAQAGKLLAYKAAARLLGVTK